MASLDFTVDVEQVHPQSVHLDNAVARSGGLSVGIRHRRGDPGRTAGLDQWGEAAHQAAGAAPAHE